MAENSRSLAYPRLAALRARMSRILERRARNWRAGDELVFCSGCDRFRGRPKSGPMVSEAQQPGQDPKHFLGVAQKSDHEA